MSARPHVVSGIARLATLLRLRVCLAALLLAMGSAWGATRLGPGGLFPQMQTRAIAYDSRGVLWWGTEDELIRFDGHRVVAVELQRLGELEDRGIRALLASADGMYVATHHGLRHVDRQGQLQQAITAQGRAIADVLALARVADDVYAVTAAGELYRVEGASAPGVAERLSLEGWPPGLNARGVDAGAGVLYFSSVAGVYRVDLRERHAGLVDPGVDGLSAQAQAASVHEDERFLWLGYWNDGLVRIDRKGGASRWYRPDAEPGRPRTQSVQDFARGPGDRLLIGTNRGIVVYREGCDCLSELMAPEWGEVAGNGAIVYRLLVDDAGLWAATPQALFRFNRASYGFAYLQKSDDGSGLASTAIYGLAEGAGRLWLAGYGGGLNWIESPQDDPAGWTIGRPQDMPEGAKFVWDIAPHAERTLLATGWGLFALDGDRVQRLEDQVQSLRRVRREGDGVLVGSLGGLFRWHQERVEAIPVHAGSPPVVWDFHREGERLWVATESGLFARDGSGPVLHVGAGAGEDQLPGDTVFRFEVAADGRRWLASNGGLVEWREEGGRQRFLRQPALLERDIRHVRTLVAMQDGELWLGAPQGIVRFRPPSEVRVFNANDGVLAGHYWPRGAERVGARVFMANGTGVTHFLPADLDVAPPTLRPQALRWRIDDAPWQDGERVRLVPGQRSLAVEFWSGEYTHADEAQYEFSLRDRDPEFRSLGAARELLLQDLRPGEYTLWLRARLRHEPASERAAQVLAIEVLPAWYQHPVGIGLLGGLGLLALFLLLFVRERWARQRAAELRALVDARTAELARANSLLQQQALHDVLTGLANRRQLFEYAAGMASVQYALLLIDIDHFKAINDRFGHRVGDRALVALAALLQDCASRHADALAVRNGGEEFLLLLPHALADQAAAVADRLLSEARAIPLRGEYGESFHLTLSIGVAIRGVGETIDSAMHRADQAMYRAKAGGRARFEMAP